MKQKTIKAEDLLECQRNISELIIDSAREIEDFYNLRLENETIAELMIKRISIICLRDIKDRLYEFLEDTEAFNKQELERIKVNSNVLNEIEENIKKRIFKLSKNNENETYEDSEDLPW
jgi:hypothetical protein